MSKFNGGKPYHGSSKVQRGRLQGSTAETDYFYFFCPRCPDKQVLRLLDYAIHAEAAEHPYAEHVTKKAKRAFALAFHLYCESCKFTDFVKISNTGWQGGSFTKLMERVGA